MNSNLQKKGFIVVFITTLFLISQIAFAQTTPTDETITNEQATAGITPDSWLYGLDVAIDKISFLLTFDNTAKARKGLEIARERLLEVKEMIEENKFEAAEKAQNKHANVLDKVTSAIANIERTNSTQEIEEEIEIEKELKEHKTKIENIKGELKVKIKIKGEITEEQQALIDSILNSLENKTGKVKIEIDNKKGKTKIKIELETGKSSEEIEDEIEKLEIKAGLTEIEVEAEIVNEQSEVKIERKFSTTTVDKDTIINEIIEKFALDRETADAALEIEIEEKKELKEEFKIEVEVEEGITKVEVKLKLILNTTSREEILDAVVEKSQLTKEQIESVMKFEIEKEEEAELEIEVEIEESKAGIKVEFAGEEFEFTLETTDREIIISEIIARTGLTREQIESVIEFGEERKTKEKDNEEREETGCIVDADCEENRVCVEGECEKIKEE